MRWVLEALTLVELLGNERVFPPWVSRTSDLLKAEIHLDINRDNRDMNKTEWSTTPKIKTNVDRQLAKEIVDCLQGFEEEVSVGPPRYPLVAFSHNSQSIELQGDAAAAYYRALALLRVGENFGLSDRYSDRVIQDQFNELLLDIYDKYGATNHIQTIRDKIHDWWQTLISATPTEYTFYFVVESINLASDWTIGSCTLSPLTRENTSSITAEALRFRGNKVQAVLEQHLSFLNPVDRKDLVLCTVTQHGHDNEFARIAATTTAEGILELLRFLGLSSNNPSFATHISFWDGQETKLAIPCLSIAKNADVHIHTTPPRILWLDLERVEHATVRAFTQLYTIPIDERSEVEASVVRAIHWLSKTASETSILNALLFTWLAYETLFAEGNRGVSSALVCERIALLHSSDPRQRRLAFNRANDLRQRRNRATHHGENQVRNEDQHLLMVCKRLSYNIMREFLFLAQTGEWKTPADVTAYFDNLRFGEVTDATDTTE